VRKIVTAMVSLAVLLPVVAAGARKQEKAQAAPSESRMGVVIQCPYIPEGMETVPNCQGRPATCVGTDGDDVIWGTEDDDVILGRLGDDVIQGDDGDDVVCAGPGNDALHGAPGDDFLFGEAGNDWLFGAKGKDSLYGGEGERDVLFGGPELDFLDGGPGDRDVCLQQKDEAKVNEETCEVIYPPPGYTHHKQHSFRPGIIEEAMPHRRNGD
jgi:hypothetical protein